MTNGLAARLAVVVAMTAAAAFLVVLIISRGDVSLQPMGWTAPVAAVAVTVPLWWLAIERPGRASRRRGALVGATSVVLAHPIALFLVAATTRWGTVVDATGTVVTDPIRLVFWWAMWSLEFSIYALAFFGVVSVTVGALAGAFLAPRLRARVEPQQLSD